ncbi:hypothetical protein BX666DRAFT_1919911 [Dichotomocladium elegans]|nr:hypothetical protein BX666DRAFT_1919911 [Dichotomocladium elegans]
MLVAGDHQGLMRIFGKHCNVLFFRPDMPDIPPLPDVRTMKAIMEWRDPSRRPSCVAQFSFDENSIYTVDSVGQLSQWSIHKPGTSLNTHHLPGFPPPAVYPRKSVSTSVTALPPRPTSNPSTSSLSRLSISSNRSNRLPFITVDDSITQSLLSFTPRSQMVAFSADTEFCLCATTSRKQSLSSSSSFSSLSSASESQSLATTHGTIFKMSDGQSALQFGYRQLSQKLTAVDWTNSSNACLLGSADGSVSITSLIKV